MTAQIWIIILVVIAFFMLIEKWVAIRKGINTYTIVDVVSNLTCGLLERVVAGFWQVAFF